MLAMNSLYRRLGERHRAHVHDLPRRPCFSLVGPTEFEYPEGTVLMSNDWRFDLDTIES
jgi:hypothetical protein